MSSCQEAKRSTDRFGILFLLVNPAFTLATNFRAWIEIVGWRTCDSVFCPIDGESSTHCVNLENHDRACRPRQYQVSTQYNHLLRIQHHRFNVAIIFVQLIARGRGGRSITLLPFSLFTLFASFTLFTSLVIGVVVGVAVI